MSEEEEKSPFAAALRFLTDQERRLLADHPAPRDLAAYHSGELSPEAEARMREHLALCRDCGDLLLDLAGFAKLKPPPGVPELTDEEVSEGWRTLQARLEEGTSKEAGKVAEVVPIRRAGTPAVPKPRRQPWLRLAAVLVMTVGAAVGLYQYGQWRESQEPWRVIELGDVERSAGPQDEMFADEKIRLELDATSDKEYAAYEVEITLEGGVVRREEGHIDSASNEVHLGFPRNSLEPGVYDIRLYGIENGRKEEISEWSLRVLDR